MPGISLLVRNSKGTWFGATGKAECEHNIPFDPGQVASVASITKFVMGTLVFKLMEDSVRTGLGYSLFINQSLRGYQNRLQTSLQMAM